MKKILFNCTTNIKGGAVQNAANFIRHASNDDSFKYLFLVSREVGEVLKKWGLSEYKVLTPSPSKSIDSRKKILTLENKYSPDLVYTMAGPAYVRFKSKHILGNSDPYVSHAPFGMFFFRRNILQGLFLLISIFYKAFYIRFFAEKWIFQTEYSRSKFIKKYFVKKENTYVVPNAIGDEFVESLKKDEDTIIQEDSKKIVIFCPTANYPHKNLEILINLAELWKNSKNDKSLKIVLPIKDDKKFIAFASKKNVLGAFDFIGPYNYANASNHYLKSNIVVMPSLLESFSTSYLEGLLAKKPLVVPDQRYSKEICKNYAFYYDKKDPFSLYLVIKQIVEKNNGKLLDYNKAEDYVYRTYGDQKNRYNAIRKVLKLNI